jgi:ribosomal protein S14
MTQEKKRTKDKKKCIRCKARDGVISKYGLNLCRRCFKDKALELGFKKY